MVTVIISPRRVVKFLDGGGHFWVYMQYVQGLHQLGCEVYWLERFHSSGDQTRDASCAPGDFLYDDQLCSAASLDGGPPTCQQQGDLTILICFGY